VHYGFPDSLNLLSALSNSSRWRISSKWRSTQFNWQETQQVL